MATFTFNGKEITKSVTNAGWYEFACLGYDLTDLGKHFNENKYKFSIDLLSVCLGESPADVADGFADLAAPINAAAELVQEYQAAVPTQAASPAKKAAKKKV